MSDHVVEEKQVHGPITHNDDAFSKNCFGI